MLAIREAQVYIVKWLSSGARYTECPEYTLSNGSLVGPGIQSSPEYTLSNGSLVGPGIQSSPEYTLS